MENYPKIIPFTPSYLEHCVTVNTFFNFIIMSQNAEINFLVYKEMIMNICEEVP